MGMTSAYPDLAKVEDWLNGRGYTGEAGSCHAAMDEIRHLRAENEKLRAVIRESDTNFMRVDKERMKLRAALAPFVDARHFKVLLNVGTTEENNQVSIRVKESDLRAAAAALKETGG